MVDTGFDVCYKLKQTKPKRADRRDESICPFLLYRKLRCISYKAKKCSAWIALRRNRICRLATRRRRRILLCRILFSLYRKLRCISYKAKKCSAWIALRKRSFYFFVFEIEEQFDNIKIGIEYSDNLNNRGKPQKKYCWNGGKHGTTENTV